MLRLRAPNIGPNKPVLLKTLSAIAIFFFSFTVYAVSVPQYGLTWDEPFYVLHSEKIAQWFSMFAGPQNPFEDRAVEAAWNYDRYHNCHPPFYKLSGIVFSRTLGGWLFDDLLSSYRISTVFWASLLILFLYFYLRKAYTNSAVAVAGSLLFLFSPRFFAHAHFYATDMMVAALGFITLYLVYYRRNGRFALLWASACAGALLAVKFTGLLIFPLALATVFTVKDKKQFAAFYLRFCLLAGFFFVLLNPHSWFGQLNELRFYFQSVLERESTVPIATLYFGKIYPYRLPWHQPFVMLAIALPAITVIFAIFGLLLHPYRRARKEWFFETGSFLILCAVFILPSTPKHDGIRLFSIQWPFIMLLCVRGIVCLTNAMMRFAPPKTPQWIRFSLQGAVLVVTVLLSAHACLKTHPYQLSYYNGFVGGTRGAAEAGFTVSYWYEALNREAVEKINRLADAEGVFVYSYPNKDILGWNKWLGNMKKTVYPADRAENADYVLLIHRIVPSALQQSLAGLPREFVITATDRTPLLEMIRSR
ncbi:MAG TPA: ArnT family glycosyltransferase [Desulfobacterales bacterium]